MADVIYALFPLWITILIFRIRQLLHLLSPVFSTSFYLFQKSMISPLQTIPIPIVSIPLIFSYLRCFCQVANLATTLASSFVFLMQLSAYVSRQVKSQMRHLLMLQGTIVALSDLFPSSGSMSVGSNCAAMATLTNPFYNKMLTSACLKYPPAFLKQEIG